MRARIKYLCEAAAQCGRNQHAANVPIWPEYAQPKVTRRWVEALRNYPSIAALSGPRCRSDILG